MLSRVADAIPNWAAVLILPAACSFAIASALLPLPWMRMTAAAVAALIGTAIMFGNWVLVVRMVRTGQYHSSLPLFGAALVIPLLAQVALWLGASKGLGTASGLAVGLLDPGCMGSFWIGPLIWWVWRVPRDPRVEPDRVDAGRHGPA